MIKSIYKLKKTTLAVLAAIFLVSMVSATTVGAEVPEDYFNTECELSDERYVDSNVYYVVPVDDLQYLNETRYEIDLEEEQVEYFENRPEEVLEKLRQFHVSPHYEVDCQNISEYAFAVNIDELDVSGLRNDNQNPFWLVVGAGLLILITLLLILALITLLLILASKFSDGFREWIHSQVKR